MPMLTASISLLDASKFLLLSHCSFYSPINSHTQIQLCMVILSYINSPVCSERCSLMSTLWSSTSLYEHIAYFTMYFCYYLRWSGAPDQLPSHRLVVWLLLAFFSINNKKKLFPFCFFFVYDHIFFFILLVYLCIFGFSDSLHSSFTSSQFR